MQFCVIMDKMMSRSVINVNSDEYYHHGEPLLKEITSCYMLS